MFWGLIFSIGGLIFSTGDLIFSIRGLIFSTRGLIFSIGSLIFLVGRGLILFKFMHKNALRYIHATTKCKLGHSSTNLQDIIDWCQNNCDVPDDPDQVFSAGLKKKKRKTSE